MKNRWVSHLLRAHLAVAAVTLPGAVCAQDLPPKIQILVGLSAGGPTDIAARLVADQLRARYNIVVVVDNRPGANGQIAANALHAAAPDGQTLLVSSQGLFTITPHLSKLPYDPLKAFTPIAGFAFTEVALCVPKALPADNLADFAKAAKAASPSFSLGTAGLGNITHLLLERFREEMEFKYVPVPYKGIAQSMQDVAAGQINGSICALSVAVPLIQSGRVKALAVVGESRSKLLPDVPSTVEQGVMVREVPWFGFFGPPDMPKETVASLSKAIGEIMNDPSMVESLTKIGLKSWFKTPDELSNVMQAESQHWSKVIRENGIGQ